MTGYGPEVYRRSALFGHYGKNSPLLDLINEYTLRGKDTDWVRVIELAMDAAALGLDISDAEVVRKILERASEKSQEAEEWRSRQENLDERYAAQSLVYYVMLPGNTIKIGTTVNLRARLGNLRVEPSALAATEPGSYALERMRHQQFKHLRVGRWENFRPDEDLMSHIAMIVKHFGPPKLTGYLRADRHRVSAG